MKKGIDKIRTNPVRDNRNLLSNGVKINGNCWIESEAEIGVISNGVNKKPAFDGFLG
jgi:hypothetical protein